MNFPLGIRLEHHFSQVDGPMGPDCTHRKYIIPGQPPSLDIDLGQLWLESAQELTPKECERLGVPHFAYLVTMKGLADPGGSEVRFRFIATTRAYMALCQLGPGGLSIPVIR